MKKKKVILVVVIVLAVFFIAKRKIELAHAPVFGKRPVLVSVFYSQKRDLKSFKEYLAKVEPENTASVSTRLSAVVKKIFVDEGSVVGKGDLLAELDKKDVLAKLNSAKQALSAAEENFNYWQKEYTRDENLFKQGAISEEERDRAKNSFAQAKAKLDNAKENVQFWQANLNYTEIKSPYNGVISKRFVDEGDLASLGKPLFIVEDRSRLKLSFDVPQEDIPFIKTGETVIYKVNNKIHHTQITNVFPTLTSGRLLHVEAYIKDKEGVHSGEFIPVKVVVLEAKGAVVIPKSALVRENNRKAFVFVVENNVLKKYPVVAGMEEGEFVEVKNLKEGLAVVKSPYLSWTKLAQGEPVKIINKKRDE